MEGTLSDSFATFGGNMSSRIYYTKPSITEKEVAYATDAARNGWGEHCYEYIERFEQMFCDYSGAKYAIATSSCTGALHMGMAALGIGPGDEVILADTNWIATAAPITYLGATPVFVDILPDTWCIDPEKVKNAITSRTKAIIAVHLYGNLCEMDQLLEIGHDHNIPIIEDAAEAIGSYWHNHHAGTMGTFGTFSFHGTKTLTTGEGGMFVTNDEKLHETVLTLSNHGRSGKQTRQFWPDMIGFKYKMSNIEAAIGCAQIERIEELVKKKREIFSYYYSQLGHINGLTMNPEKEGTINGYWMPTIVFDQHLGISRERLLKTFSEQKIDARVFFWPLSQLTFFKNKYENFNAISIAARAINLPSYHELQPTDMERIIFTIYKLLNN
jgi:perosamine synthetase